MNKRTYAGIPEKYAKIDTSKVVLIPVPYDGTIDWKKIAEKLYETSTSANKVFRNAKQCK